MVFVAVCLCRFVVADVLPLEGVDILDEEDEDNDADENATAAHEFRHRQHQVDAPVNDQARAHLPATRAEAARQNAEYARLP